MLISEIIPALREHVSPGKGVFESGKVDFEVSAAISVLPSEGSV
jgi:hypothetical protein